MAPPSSKLQAPDKPVLSELTLYFPHVDYGQSVLIQLPENRWIVVDANHAPSDSENGTLELLEDPASRSDFKIIALVITHFHEDHSSGVPDLLAFCEKVSLRQDRLLDEVIEVLVLPQTYGDFYRFVKAKITKKEEEEPKLGPVKTAHLRKLLSKLDELNQKGVQITTCPVHQFTWKTRPWSAGPEPAESWIFTYHPAPAESLGRFLAEGAANEPLPSPRELEGKLHQDANRYSYVLSVGHGRESADFHVLLTADIPGKVFSQLTRDLRDKHMPAAAKGRTCAPFLLNQLSRHGSSAGDRPPRLRPVQCLTVPHHGSGKDAAKAEDLDWWLDDERGQPDRPALAVVQGGPYALRDDTLDELFKARLHVFASTEPLRIQRFPPGHTGCRELDDRLLAPPEAGSPPRNDTTQSGSGPGPAHLALHGGSRGVQCVMVRDFYRIPPSHRVEHYNSNVVYERGRVALV